MFSDALESFGIEYESAMNLANARISCDGGTCLGIGYFFPFPIATTFREWHGKGANFYLNVRIVLICTFFE